MTIDGAIKVLIAANRMPSINDGYLGEAIETAIKAFETIQRIDDVLDTEGMTEVDILDEILDAMSEFRYDCEVEHDD